MSDQSRSTQDGYRMVCSEGHKGDWTTASLAWEERDVHNGAPDPTHGRYASCPDGGHAKVEKRGVTDGE
jgi:hypothetical protein